MKRNDLIKQRAETNLLRACALEDKGRITSAIKLYRQAAHLGDAIAQSNLGNLLDDKIRPGRPSDAVYWYKRSVRLGHPTAAYNLAIHYRNLGKHRWHLHWLQVAERLGDPDAGAEIKDLLRV